MHAALRQLGAVLLAPVADDASIDGVAAAHGLKASTRRRGSGRTEMVSVDLTLSPEMDDIHLEGLLGLPRLCFMVSGLQRREYCPSFLDRDGWRVRIFVMDSVGAVEQLTLVRDTLAKSRGTEGATPPSSEEQATWLALTFYMIALLPRRISGADIEAYDACRVKLDLPCMITTHGDSWCHERLAAGHRGKLGARLARLPRERRRALGSALLRIASAGSGLQAAKTRAVHQIMRSELQVSAEEHGVTSRPLGAHHPVGD